MPTLLAYLSASVLSGCFGSTAFVESANPCARLYMCLSVGSVIGRSLYYGRKIGASC